MSLDRTVVHQDVKGANGSVDTCAICDVLALIQGYIQISAHLQSIKQILNNSTGYDTLEQAPC